MPRPKQTEAEREAMRTRILDAAHELLMEQGPEALSVRSIADRVGVSHMVLYTYFENHEALVQALRARFRGMRRAAHTEELRQAQTGDVVAVMREVLSQYAVRAEEHPRMYKFRWVQPASNVPHHDPRRPFSGNVQHLSELIRIGIDRGIFMDRDPMLAAATIFSIVHGPLLLFHNGRLAEADLRDRMSAEALEVAMGYLMHDT